MSDNVLAAIFIAMIPICFALLIGAMILDRWINKGG